jgi:hypothetical protein
MRVIFIAGLTDGGHAIISRASTLVITHVSHHIIRQTSSLKMALLQTSVTICAGQLSRTTTQHSVIKKIYTSAN